MLTCGSVFRTIPLLELAMPLFSSSSWSECRSSGPIFPFPGFVDVVDVLPQEEYRARYPTGESNSPFVFICTNPHELIVRYPMKVCAKALEWREELRKAELLAPRALHGPHPFCGFAIPPSGPAQDL